MNTANTNRVVQLINPYGPSTVESILSNRDLPDRQSLQLLPSARLGIEPTIASLSAVAPALYSTSQTEISRHAKIPKRQQKPRKSVDGPKEVFEDFIESLQEQGIS